MAMLTMVEAINLALKQEMEKASGKTWERTAVFFE
jgi:hypothetical protein